MHLLFFVPVSPPPVSLKSVVFWGIKAQTDPGWISRNWRCLALLPNKAFIAHIQFIQPNTHANISQQTSDRYTLNHVHASLT